jgi:hypothetical protein
VLGDKIVSQIEPAESRSSSGSHIIKLLVSFDKACFKLADLSTLWPILLNCYVYANSSPCDEQNIAGVHVLLVPDRMTVSKSGLIFILTVSE